MATRAKVKEDLLDLIVANILDYYPSGDMGDGSGYPTFDPAEYRKNIDPDTGQIKIGTSGTSFGSTVIYQEDYQDFENTFTEYLETVVDCYCMGSLTNNICSTDYYEVASADAIWQDADTDVVYNECSGGTDSFGSNCFDLIEEECGTTNGADVYNSCGPDDGVTTNSISELCSDVMSEGDCDGGCEPILSPLGDCQKEFVSLDGFLNYRIEWDLGGYNSCSPGDLEFDDFDLVFLYLSQLVGFDRLTTEIDSDQAREVLDTTIFELLPREITRQEKINKFFQDFENLVGEIPAFNFDVDSDGINDTWYENIITEQNNYSTTNDVINNLISGNISRLDRHATGAEDDQNVGKTLESLRNRINDHLTDIDKKIDPVVSDERPTYDENNNSKQFKFYVNELCKWVRKTEVL